MDINILPTEIESANSSNMLGNKISIKSFPHNENLTDIIGDKKVYGKIIDRYNLEEMSDWQLKCDDEYGWKLNESKFSIQNIKEFMQSFKYPSEPFWFLVELEDEIDFDDYSNNYVFIKFKNSDFIEDEDKSLIYLISIPSFELLEIKEKVQTKDFKFMGWAIANIQQTR